jgi:hypothetical protein
MTAIDEHPIEILQKLTIHPKASYLRITNGRKIPFAT